jgi:hypothetical protein
MKAIGDMLLQAIKAYDYPPVTYDFVQQREIRFSTVQDLDNYLTLFCTVAILST